MDNPSKPLSVAVAVSGGADSLYCLLHLRERGFAVRALHGVFFDPHEAREAEAARAMRERLSDCCTALGVALHVVDLREAFARLVIRPFVEAYAQGLTPNPCALCNAELKFGLLLKKALELGADRLATGHYATLLRAGERLEDGREPGLAPPFPALLMGADKSRDQSYFLALVPREALAGALFPLAGTMKKDVLQALERQGICPPQPGESREVCFIPGDDYRAVLPRMAEAFGITLPGPGPMLLGDGTCLGAHLGLWRYTEGQRRGLGIGWREPLHVLGKERRGNILRLGPRADMAVSACECERVNVLLPPESWPESVLVKTRYRERPKEARALVVPNGDAPLLRIRFAGCDTAAAPGQVAAVYVPWGGDPSRLRLAAGGVIVRSEGRALPETAP